MMKYIVYISSAVGLMSDDRLIEILNISNKNNTARNITGILLYSKGTFLQIIEGMPEEVDTLFNNIKADKRHRDVIKLFEKPLAERNFPAWSMGFASADAHRFNEIMGYVKPKSRIATNDTASMTTTILKTFIETEKMALSY